MDVPVIEIELGDDYVAQFILRDIHFNIHLPDSDSALIRRMIKSFKEDILFPWLEKHTTLITPLGLHVGFILDDYLVIGFYKQELWSEDLIRKLEEHLDITYKEDMFYYGSDMYEKKFLINNTETEELWGCDT